MAWHGPRLQHIKHLSNLLDGMSLVVMCDGLSDVMCVTCLVRNTDRKAKIQIIMKMLGYTYMVWYKYGHSTLFCCNIVVVLLLVYILIISYRCNYSVKHFQVSYEDGNYHFGLVTFPSLDQFLEHFDNQPLIGGEAGKCCLGNHEAFDDTVSY